MTPLDRILLLPLAGHCGSFAAVRKHDIHTGIDLYADNNSPVFAMVDGTVVDILDFTGPSAGTPWWLDTRAVVIEDVMGLWLYGEINPIDDLAIGSVVVEGTTIGHVARVLRNDKGLPTAMLHLERYNRRLATYGPVWNHGDCCPTGLIDPTPLLANLISLNTQP